MPKRKPLNQCECGGDPYLVAISNPKGDKFYVRCSSNNCIRRTTNHPSRDGARADWNGEDPAEFDSQVVPVATKPPAKKHNLVEIPAGGVLRVERLPEKLSDTGERIAEVLDNIEVFLREKNHRYGNSALSPARVFFKGQIENALLVRIDDKVSRIQNSVDLRKNDVADLMGYLVLLCVAQGWTEFADLID